MGGMVVCDNVCLGVMSTFCVFSCDESQFSLVHATPREGICGNWISFGGFVFR